MALLRMALVVCSVPWRLVAAPCGGARQSHCCLVVWSELDGRRAGLMQSARLRGRLGQVDNNLRHARIKCKARA